jgi:hypothetical protein
VRNSFNAWTPTGTILIARNKNKQANIQFVEEEKPDTVYFLFKDEQVGRFFSHTDLSETCRCRAIIF